MIQIIRDGTFSEPGICVFWDFKALNGKGQWSREGCVHKASHKLTDIIYLDECHCNHLTHFGELLWNSDHPFHESYVSDLERETLDLISMIGCIVSLVSLCGVFLTALINRKWLKGPGQKMLLQMSIALALLMIMFLVGTNAKTDESECFAVVGFFLHYAILSNFCWMLVAGYLQYYRLVRVIYSRSPKLILKAAIVGWGVPLIPGALVLMVIISTKFQFYSKPPLCLPSGWAFYATILAPLCVILMCNLFTFVMIFKNLYTMVEPRRHSDICISIRRFKQLAFLFTLLGLNWVFGVCQVAFQAARVIFAYLFGFTVAFQGLAYFTFFVLMHDKAIDSWRAILCGGRMLFNVDWSSSTRESNSTTQTNTESVTFINNVN
jgi:7 transmembrane receptor (Secretin family)/GPCR proteolysis site, GPS, motif